jgi:hypothetical protein
MPARASLFKELKKDQIPVSATTGANVVKLFTAVTYKCTLMASLSRLA